MSAAGKRLAGFVFLIAAALQSQPALMLAHLIICLLLLLGPLQSRLWLIRSLRALPWFLIPLILLHGWNTPGVLAFAGLSYPGLQQGAYYTLHLSLMMFAGMVLSRSCSLSEWLSFSAQLAPQNWKLQASLYLLSSMIPRFYQLSLDSRKQWRLHAHWRDLPTVLIALFMRTWQQSKSYSYALWLRWPRHINIQKTPYTAYDQAIIVLSFIYLVGCFI